VAVLAASTAGAVVASLVLYLIGLWIGEASLRRLIKRAERFKLVSGSDLEKASEAFERHGGKAIVISHLIPGIGALIAIPAGVKRMPVLGRFTACTIVGSGLWNGAFIGLGWAFGTRWTLVERNAPIIEYVVLGTAISVSILWYLRRRRKGHR
jgi:membrane protein DedA with SNARE-associated domain